MKLETIGKIFSSGFGDRVLTGILVGFLNGVTPYRCYEYIRDNIQLGCWASDSDWQKFRRMAKGANVGNITNITIDDIIKELKKHRQDILGVILNHPNGKQWLQTQLDILKEKLEIK